jgi:hypothetical protein
MFDAIALMERAPDEDVENAFGFYEFYRVTPDVMYPPALADLVEAGELTQADADLAQRPHDDVYAEGDETAIARRAEVLTAARVHFHGIAIAQRGNGEHGIGVGVHILKQPAWRP